MTNAATKFVAPLTFETLSGEDVVTEMFPELRVVKTRHVRWAEWADCILICPATANIIGKAASGIADDFLSTFIVASRKPVLFAPAMDYQMVQNPIYLANREKLISYGCGFIDPEEGYLASGAVGPGRLACEETILLAVQRFLYDNTDLHGRKVLVTAGPTRESLDPVRFISNRSTGKMGYMLAEAAYLRGAEVTLISGPTELRPPPVSVLIVETAEEMKHEVIRNLEKSEILIMAAAVADYQPEKPVQSKIKKSGKSISLPLVQTTDILAEVGSTSWSGIKVGFALETENAEEEGARKLQQKNLDLICVNNCLEEGAGFGVETNRVTIIDKQGEKERLPLMTKRAVAERILDRIASLLSA